MSTENPTPETTPYDSIAWASDNDVQCKDHEWVTDDESAGGHSKIHVCGLVREHDGPCVCVECDGEFDGGVIQDDRWKAEDLVGRPWNEGRAS